MSPVIPNMILLLFTAVAIGLLSPIIHTSEDKQSTENKNQCSNSWDNNNNME